MRIVMIKLTRSREMLKAALIRPERRFIEFISMQVVKSS